MMNIKDFTLCCNCRNSMQCLLESRSMKPLLFCELFEVEPASSGGASQREGSASATSHALTDTDLGREKRYLGLCFDCENRSGCSLVQKSDGGVWHCEEYR